MTDTPKGAVHENVLPDELLWAERGHASDVVLTALADGQNDIVPPEVRAHVQGCVACTMHLGNAALLSLHTERELGVMSAVAKAALPLPRRAIALGLLVAALGLLPTLFDSSSRVGDARTFATRDLPVFFRAFGTVARRIDASTAGIVFMYGSAAILVAMALMLVRFASKKEVSR